MGRFGDDPWRDLATIYGGLPGPREWADDHDRCRSAGIPEETGFATRIAQAKDMLGRALDASVPSAWVTGDEVYGAWAPRRWLEDRERPYVLAVRSNQQVGVGTRQLTVASLAASLPPRSWRRIAVAAGEKGPREHEWVRVAVNYDLGPSRARWLLIRRNPDDPTDLAYYIAVGPDRTTLTRLAEVTGIRWAVEGAFESAKQESGLADYEVRSWTGWHRHVTLSMLAHAILAAVRRLADAAPPKTPATAS